MPRIRKDGQLDRRAETAPLNAVKVLDPEQSFRAGLLAEAGNGRRIIEGGTNLTEHQAAQLSRLVGMPADQFREQLAARFQAILDLLSARLFESIDQLAPKELAVNIGILTDKYSLLRGISAPTTINQTNIQINGVDRSQAMAQLGNTRAQPKEQPQQALQAARHTHVLDLTPSPTKAKEMVLANGSIDLEDVLDGGNRSSPAETTEKSAVASPRADPSHVTQSVDGQQRPAVAQ